MIEGILWGLLAFICVAGIANIRAGPYESLGEFLLRMKPKHPDDTD
jgi:hypothetical protein